MAPNPWPVVLTLLFAGCIQAEDVPAVELDSPTTDPPAPSATPGPVVLNETLANESSSTDETLRQWEIINRRGPFAARIQAHVPVEGPCEFGFASSGGFHPGPADVIVIESKVVRAWSVTSGGYLAHAHAGPIDTRTASDSDGWIASSTTMRMSKFQGDITFEVAYADLLPVEGSSIAAEWLPNGSVARIVLDCEGPIEVRGLLAGTEVRLFDTQTMDGGVGATVASATSANYEDRAELKTTRPTGVAMMGSFGDQVGTFEWTAPGGGKSCTLSPGSADECRVEGGPGVYGATLTRAAASFEAFWGMILGLEPVEDLDLPSPAAAAEA